MIQRGQHHVMADEGAISDENAPLILEFAAHVDEDTLSDMDILSAVGIKGRKHRKALVHRLADQPGEQGPQLLRLMAAAVDFRCDLQRLLTDAVHEQMGFAAAFYRFSAVQVFPKLL